MIRPLSTVIVCYEYGSGSLLHERSAELPAGVTNDAKCVNLFKRKTA